MDDTLAGLRPERFEQLGVQAGLVVDPARRVEGDGEILIENHRVRAGKGAVARERRGYRPRRGPQKSLARHGGEGRFDGPIVETEDRQHLPGIGAPRHGEVFAGGGVGFGGRSGGGWRGAASLSSGEPAGVIRRRIADLRLGTQDYR